METIAYTISGTTTEVSFTALGVGANPRLTLGTHGPSKFTLPLPGTAPEMATVIPFEARCKIYTGRTYSAGSWTGGSILFQGFRTDNSGNVSGASVSSELVIEDEWYFLRNLTLQASWTIITGGTLASPTYGSQSWPDCVLFQATPGVNYTTFPIPNNTAALEGHITTGQAIIEILNYAIAQGANLQVGLINPSLYVPYYPVRSMRCADALKICLRVHPDCTTEIDYTTTPPTFNVRQRSNLAALTLPYNGATTSSGVTRSHITSQIKPRPDLVPTRVAISIKTIGTEAGQQVVTLAQDIYPTGVATGLRSFDASMDMTGPKSSLTTAQVTSTANAFSTLAWWELKHPALTAPETVPGSVSLVNTNINDGSLNCITVVDESGNPVNLTTYPCVMEHEGTIHPWMTIPGTGPVLGIKAIVTGYFTYQRRKNTNTAGSPNWITTKQPNTHAIPIRVHLTNSPAGTQTYWLSQLLSTGESYPGGLAQGIYTALSSLQYEFNHTILDVPAPGSLLLAPIKPGKHSLNVSGGASAWSTMAAMIQEVTIDFIKSPATGLTSAKTSVRCGPVAHLEPGQLVQLFNLFTNRDLNKINPNERTSGLPNGGLNAAMPCETAKENTTQGEPDEGQQMFTAPDSVTTANFNGIQHDPANGQINVTTYLPASSTPVGTGLIAPCYFGAGAPGAANLPANVNFRVNWRYLDTSGNAEYYCSTAGTKSTSVWTQLNGAAGAAGGVWL
jgi:hypothetical protein